MCVRQFGIFAVTLVFSNIKNVAAESPNHNILHLLSKVKPSYIAVFYQKGENIKEVDDLKTDVDVTSDITPDIDSLGPPYDQKAYLLYHALRTTEEREQIDPETARQFEKTKDVLRQALRMRCKKLNSCYRKCPKKFYIKCTFECRETYDDYDVCQEKKQPSCYSPKCGKTMPPSWLKR